MERVIDAVAHLVTALQSIGLRPPVAIVLESDHEVHSIEVEAAEIWDRLLAAAPAHNIDLPQPMQILGCSSGPIRHRRDAAVISRPARRIAFNPLLLRVTQNRLMAVPRRVRSRKSAPTGAPGAFALYLAVVGNYEVAGNKPTTNGRRSS